MRRLVLLILALVSQASLADWLAWDYDLQSCPPGWEVDPEWEFSSEGMNMSAWVGTPYTCEWGDVFTASLLLPFGCDSIVLHIESDLSLSSSGNGYAGAEIHCRIDEGDWQTLFDEGIYYQSTDPIHLHVPTYPCGLLDFNIVAYAGKGNDMYPGWGSINWLLHDLTLTFYGDNVQLQQVTWGSIKTGE